MVGVNVMSNDEKGFQDQASNLRVRAKAKQALPPRSELHANKKKKMKWKIHYPMVRLIGISFFLIPIAILALVFSNDKNIISKILTPTESSIYEPVQVLKPTPAPPPAKEDEKSDKEKEEPKELEKKEDEMKEETNDSSEEEEETEQNNEQVIDESKVEDYEIIYHTVQTGETLFSISVKYYNGRHGEKIIKDYNNLITNQVNVGQTLKIPMKKDAS